MTKAEFCFDPPRGDKLGVIAEDKCIAGKLSNAYLVALKHLSFITLLREKRNAHYMYVSKSLHALHEAEEQG